MERFDAREENCIPLSIDSVAMHLTGNLYDREQTENIKTVKQTVEFFADKFLLKEAFYHPIFCLNLKYAKLFYKYNFKPISVLRSKKSVVPDSAYMFFSCGNDLYGIPECWNHMVVELFGKTEKERTFYDSYIDIVREDYPHLNIRDPAHAQLMNMMTICLIIGRN